jgi:uncharacterized protein YegL
MMPSFDDPEMNTHRIAGSRYGFSAARPTDLGASEYTLVGLSADCSSSVAGFAREIEKCVTEVVRSCRSSPRADNLLVRFTTFADAITEVHGFRPLPACPPSAYRGSIRPDGCTALCDATHNAVEAVVRYGADLHDHDFDVNAIVFVITDGGENASSTAARDVEQALARAARDGKLSSVVSILVGVAVDTAALSAELQRFRRDVGFDEYIELQRADAATLARLASFVSRSISVQSQSLASGGGKQVLGF